MQSGRLGQERSRGSPRPARYKNTDPGRAGSVRPVRCPRSGAPQHRRDNHPLRVPRQPLLYVHRHGTLKPPALFHVKHVSHQACGIRCTERHYAAPEFTDSRQRRFLPKSLPKQAAHWSRYAIRAGHGRKLARPSKGVTSLPSWLCGFDSRRPLPGKTPSPGAVKKPFVAVL